MTRFTDCFCAGLGDAWGSAPLCNNPRETCIKELGSHLLQVMWLSAGFLPPSLNSYDS